MTMMNKSRISCSTSLFAFLLGLALAGVAAADNNSEKAKELINKMSQAMRTLNYEGVFIYRYGDTTINTMQIIHKADGDGEHQRLVSLSGSAREVIRNNDSVTCIFPEDRAVMVEKSRSTGMVLKLPRPIETVSDVYKFSTVGTDRIAGRTSWIVSISPRDQYRYGYKLWIDQNSYLLLRSDLHKGEDEILEQIFFTQLAIRDSIPEAKLEPSLTGKDYVWYENDAAEHGSNPSRKGWHVTWMPDGFNMQAQGARSMPTSREPVEHLVYTDGIANVSVFIEKSDSQNSDSTGASRMGGVNTFARRDNGYRITAVGEVPRTTVERMAKSVVSDN